MKKIPIQKPYNINISGQTIDGNLNYTLRWSVSGSIQTSYQIIVLNNSNNSLLWDSGQINSYSTQHVIPGTTILNGFECKLTVKIWDSGSNFAISDPVFFRTSSTPVCSVNTIGTVTTSSYLFTFQYSQAEAVVLSNWQVFLYNSDQVLISSSGIQTSTTLEYLFTDLQSEKDYYIEFQATSSLGLVGTSGKILFSVLYTSPAINFNLMAENVENAGIKISMSIIRIIGIASPDQPTYIDNTKIDLTTNNSFVYFSDGFSVLRDFTLKIWLQNPHVTNDTLINDSDYLLLLIGNNNWKIFLQYRSDNKFHLFKKVGNIYSHYTSEEVVGTSFFVCLKQIGNSCDCIAETI